MKTNLPKIFFMLRSTSYVIVQNRALRINRPARENQTQFFLKNTIREQVNKEKRAKQISA